MEEKLRMIQEYVPGKQITLAHIISNASNEICRKIGVMEGAQGAIGILTLTPSETAIIAGDIALKAADIEIIFVDRFSGSLVIKGDTASCEAAVTAVVDFVGNIMGFSYPSITRS